MSTPPASPSPSSRTRGWLRRIALGLFICAAVGCPARPPAHALPPLERAVSAEPRAEADFRGASQARAEGRLDEAYQRFRAFLDVWPDDPLAPYARLELGGIDLDRGKNAEARRWFEGVAKSRDTALAERGRMYAAVAAQRLGEHQQALFVLRTLVGRTVDPRETRLVFDTIALAEEAIGDDLSALETRNQELSTELSEAERHEVEGHVRGIVERLDPALELPRAYDILPRKGYAWPVVARRLLVVSHERGERERVQQIAADLDAQGQTLDEELRALVLRAERASDADPGVIGAILPLSGRGREVGEAALHGLMLASEGGAGGSKGPRLIYRDDMGDPQRAQEALEDLVTLHRVIAIVGPVSTASAQAVAAKARELSLPMIALSPDRSLSEGPGAIYRVLPEPNEESQALVRYAVNQGARRFVVLAPEGAFGATMRAAFESSVAALGGTLAGTITYPTTTTSFVKEAEQAEKLSFDAIVVADAPSRVALIAPALAAAGIWSARESKTPTERSAVFLVPSFGFDASLAKSSRRYLQRAVFSVPFDAARAPAFAEAFRGAFQSEPNLFAAAAYDSYRLLASALSTGASTREAVGKALAKAQLSDAAGAADGFAATRGPRRPTRLETLSGDAFIEIAQ